MSARDRLASYIGYEQGENDEKFTALLDEVIAERDAQIVAWLLKKAGEYQASPDRRESQADVLRRMASKISRGAVRVAGKALSTEQPERRDALMQAHAALAAQAGRDQAAINRVRQIHQRGDNGAGVYCERCADGGDINWPCATIAALDGSGEAS